MAIDKDLQANKKEIGSATKSILINTFWILFDKVLMLFLNLLVTVRVANYFGKTEYGSYEYAVSIVAILEILITFVDGRVVKKYYIDYDGNTLVFNATVCRVFFSILSVVIGMIYVINTGRGRKFSLMLIVLLLNAILTNLRFGMANRFEYLLKSRKIVVAADIAALVGGLLQLVVVQMQWPLIAIAFVTVVTATINLVIILIQYNIEFGSDAKGKFDGRLVASLIRESLPLAIAASCATIYTKCDSVMLGNMLTDAEVGIYAISVKLVSVVQIVSIAVRDSVYPKLIALYAFDKEKYAHVYIRITSILTWIYIVGVVVSFVVLPYLFAVLNPDYQDALPVYKVLVLSAFFMYNAALRAGHYTLINRGDILMYVQIPCVILNIVLNWVGIQLWGMYGAALATVFTQGISLLGSNIFFGSEGREVFRWQIQALNPIHILK